MNEDNKTLIYTVITIILVFIVTIVINLFFCGEGTPCREQMMKFPNSTLRL